MRRFRSNPSAEDVRTERAMAVLSDPSLDPDLASDLANRILAGEDVEIPGAFAAPAPAPVVPTVSLEDDEEEPWRGAAREFLQELFRCLWLDAEAAIEVLIKYAPENQHRQIRDVADQYLVGAITAGEFWEWVKEAAPKIAMPIREAARIKWERKEERAATKSLQAKLKAGAFRGTDAAAEAVRARRAMLAERFPDLFGDKDAADSDVSVVTSAIAEDEDYRDKNLSQVIHMLPARDRPLRFGEIDLRDLLITMARKRDDVRLENLIRSHNVEREIDKEEIKRVWEMHQHLERQMRDDLKLSARDEQKAQNRVFQALLRNAEKAARKYTAGRKDVDPFELAAVGATNCFTKLGSFRGEASLRTWVHRAVYNAFVNAITRGVSSGEEGTEKQRAYKKKRKEEALTVGVGSIAHGGLGLTGTAGLAATSSVPSTIEEAKLLEEMGVAIDHVDLRERPDAQEIFGDVETEEGASGGKKADPLFAETYTLFAPEETDLHFDDLELESMRVLGPEDRARLRDEIEERKAERIERTAHSLQAQLQVWHSNAGEKEDALIEQAYQNLKPDLQTVLNVRRPEFYTLPSGERIVRVPPNHLLAAALGMPESSYNRKLHEARKLLLEAVGDKIKPPYSGQLAQAYLAKAKQGRKVKPKADADVVEISYDYVEPAKGVSENDPQFQGIVAELMEVGLSEQEARDEAHRQMGGLNITRSAKVKISTDESGEIQFTKLSPSEQMRRRRQAAVEASGQIEGKGEFVATVVRGRKKAAVEEAPSAVVELAVPHHPERVVLQAPAEEHYFPVTARTTAEGRYGTYSVGEEYETPEPEQWEAFSVSSVPPSAKREARPTGVVGVVPLPELLPKRVSDIRPLVERSKAAKISYVGKQAGTKPRPEVSRVSKSFLRSNPEIRGVFYSDPWELMELWEDGFITQDEYDVCMEQLVKELEAFAV